jgi:hypothetical protein
MDSFDRKGIAQIQRVGACQNRKAEQIFWACSHGKLPRPLPIHGSAHFTDRLFAQNSTLTYRLFNQIAK